MNRIETPPQTVLETILDWSAAQTTNFILDAISSQHSDKTTKRETARLAAEKAFSGELLKGIGENTWRILWDAARRYSTEIAYAHIRLNELKLLPEIYRETFIKNVTDYAISGDDLYSLENEKFQTIFTETEYTNLKTSIRTELIPNLKTVRRVWESNFSSYNDKADEHMETYLDILSTLRSEFEEDEMALNSIQLEKNEVEEWITENSENGKPLRTERELGTINTEQQPKSQRSIFDDIED
jgi:hypothetical protein